MKKKILKESFIGTFVKGFLDDVDKNRVKSAIKTAKDNKLPTPVLDKMKELNANIKDLEDFLADLP